ncbi:MAG TPA: hypothetical protein VGP97_05500 [Burkholderiales bacterium]|jgi:hypothetical protein|nr:hypothetical protein [Burkholderiales bacterium]
MFTAIVRVTGAGRLADFRERLRWLMVRDEDAEEYSEHHAAGVLEYRFTPQKGIPFPAFTAASVDFPELQVEAEWEHDGVRGRALIENGRLVQQAPELASSTLLDVAIEANGRLELAVACSRREDTLVGYAASADRHTYFRYRDGRLELVGPDSPDEALEEVAFAFVEEWIWYNEEEAVLERARYANYGYPVHGANLRAEKLHLVRDRGLRFSSLDGPAAEAREALIEQWLKRT